MTRVKKFLTNLPSLRGKTYLITGATSGLGYALSCHLIAKGATVIMANRSKEKSEEVISKIKKQNIDAKIDVFYYDQGKKQTIIDLVNALKQSDYKIDGYILNAGVFHPRNGSKTSDAIDPTFGINYVGNYQLLKALAGAELLEENTRVVFTSSLAARNKLDSNCFIKAYNGKELSNYKRYQVSKTSVNILSLALNNRLDVGFKFNGQSALYHPGIFNSNIARFLPEFLTPLAHFFLSIVFHSPASASLGALVALTSADDLNGKMICPRGLFEMSGLPKMKKIDESILTQLPNLLEVSDII